MKRTDHRLDMSPAGWNLFVSRDKQAQNRAARRLKLGMRVVIVCVALGVVSLIGLMAAFYLVPWFQMEMTSGAVASEVSQQVSSAPPVEYDDMGLPIYKEEICLFVVNEDNPASEGFTPELTETGGVQVDVHAAEALRALTLAAKEEGLALVWKEGYVSYDAQQERYDAVVKRLREEKGLTAVMAKTEAKSQEPVPGESDFQSGMCLRLDGDPKTFEASRTYSWLKSNMGKYGFIFRYPEYKEDETGVQADPTVIRYVGGASAAAMQQRSMCLEEYLNYLDIQ